MRIILSVKSSDLLLYGSDVVKVTVFTLSKSKSISPSKLQHRDTDEESKDVGTDLQLPIVTWSPRDEYEKDVSTTTSSRSNLIQRFDEIYVGKIKEDEANIFHEHAEGKRDHEDEILFT